MTCSIQWDLQNSIHTYEVNWALQFEVSVAGTPKVEINLLRAVMQVLVEVSQTGNAVCQQVGRSKLVKTCVKPATTASNQPGIHYFFQES